MSIQAVKDAAQGQWREVLQAFGVDGERLVNRHGPCPVCGGTDRFRFDDKDGSGSYYCNQGEAGDGFRLVMLANDWSAGEALKQLATYFDIPRDAKPDHTKRDKRSWLRSIMRECTDTTAVHEYLKGRGLDTFPDTLKYHPALDYDDQQFPAMLAVVTGKDGSAQGLHRTYLADIDKRKTLTPCVSSYSGGAIRLMEANDQLAIAEGIETALAVHEIYQSRGQYMPVWATVSATMMAVFVPPKNIHRVAICGDNDKSFTGHAAAYKLAKNLTAKGVLVEVKIPPEPGDWLDVWTAKK